MKQAEPQSAGLEAIFRECAKDLSAYFARRHGGTQAADDLVQESFFQLARRLRAGQDISSPCGSLFVIPNGHSASYRVEQILVGRQCVTWSGFDLEQARSSACPYSGL